MKRLTLFIFLVFPLMVLAADPGKVAVMSTKGGELLTPKQFFSTNILVGSNITILANPTTGKITLSGLTDTNVVNALISAGGIVSSNGLSYSFSADNFTVTDLTNITLKAGSIRSNHFDASTWQMVTNTGAIAGALTNGYLLHVNLAQSLASPRLLMTNAAANGSDNYEFILINDTAVGPILDSSLPVIRITNTLLNLDVFRLMANGQTFVGGKRLVTEDRSVTNGQGLVEFGTGLFNQDVQVNGELNVSGTYSGDGSGLSGVAKLNSGNVFAASNYFVNLGGSNITVKGTLTAGTNSGFVVGADGIARGIGSELTNATGKKPVFLDTVQTNFSLLSSRPVYNVKHPPFNARGDGTGDDGPAIQAAINATKGGLLGDVYLPSGDYPHYRTITNVFTGGDHAYKVYNGTRGAALRVFGDGANTKIISYGVTNGPGISWCISKAVAIANNWGFSSVVWSDMHLLAPTNGQPAMFIGVPDANSAGMTSGQFGRLEQIIFAVYPGMIRPESLLVMSNTVNFVIDQCIFPTFQTRRANILAAHCDSLHITDTLMRANGASNAFNVEIVDTGEGTPHTGNGFVIESCQIAGPFVKGHSIRNLQIIGGHVESGVHPYGIFNFSNRCSVAIYGLDFSVVPSGGTTIYDRNPTFKLYNGAGRGVELFSPNMGLTADYVGAVSFPWFWIEDSAYTTPHHTITPRWYSSDKANRADGIQNCVIANGGTNYAYWQPPLGAAPAIKEFYFWPNTADMETSGTHTATNRLVLPREQIQSHTLWDTANAGYMVSGLIFTNPFPTYSQTRYVWRLSPDEVVGKNWRVEPLFATTNSDNISFYSTLNLLRSGKSETKEGPSTLLVGTGTNMTWGSVSLTTTNNPADVYGYQVAVSGYNGFWTHTNRILLLGVRVVNW
jgi:hypothetical protein